MKRFALAIFCCSLATSAFAEIKNCEELKNEIEVKIQARAVPSYTLEIITKEEAEKHDIAMVVGSCENGTKAIIYQKNGDDQPIGTQPPAGVDQPADVGQPKARS
ncbi:DUF1161 domain-containing protein [Pseudomonas prosekii]|uniref:DUF1161 domain-containing protein n=1 Tax=Pseudomonas prosekii TaxID=1148509 RepID=A0A1H1VUU9_9PSED|nr:DUF1161 domain-containing protein [Pseudomonas prosekii]PWE44163.1 DUF1161 domain-containing protein [Pseudomonas prosekii]SDS88552.1 Protein of unknown function [Pseudomonas prosekii]